MLCYTCIRSLPFHLCHAEHKQMRMLEIWYVRMRATENHFFRLRNGESVSGMDIYHVMTPCPRESSGECLLMDDGQEQCSENPGAIILQSEQYIGKCSHMCDCW